jgi:hypothetical protein
MSKNLGRVKFASHPHKLLPKSTTNRCVDLSSTRNDMPSPLIFISSVRGAVGAPFNIAKRIGRFRKQNAVEGLTVKIAPTMEYAAQQRDPSPKSLHMVARSCFDSHAEASFGSLQGDHSGCRNEANRNDVC